jgi:hypothetical protein
VAAEKIRSEILGVHSSIVKNPGYPGVLRIREEAVPKVQGRVKKKANWFASPETKLAGVLYPLLDKALDTGLFGSPGQMWGSLRYVRHHLAAEGVFSHRFQ